MTYREIFIIVLLMVASLGLSISPSQMKAIEFRPKKAFSEKKNSEIMATISTIALPIFGQNFQMASHFWSDRPYVLPILPRAEN